MWFKNKERALVGFKMIFQNREFLEINREILVGQ